MNNGLITVNSHFVGRPWTPPAFDRLPTRHAVASLLTATWNELSSNYPGWMNTVYPVPSARIPTNASLNYIPSATAQTWALAAGIDTIALQDWLHPTRFAPDHADALIEEATAILFDGTGWVTPQRVRTFILAPDPVGVSEYSTPLIVTMAWAWVAACWPFGTGNRAATPAAHLSPAVFTAIYDAPTHPATTIDYLIDPSVTFDAFRRDAATVTGLPIEQFQLTPTIDPEPGIIAGFDQIVTFNGPNPALFSNAAGYPPPADPMNQHLNTGWSIIGLSDTGKPLATWRLAGRIPISDPKIVTKEHVLNGLQRNATSTTSVWQPAGLLDLDTADTHPHLKVT